ncbi:MAG: helix-turn-helix domain-containing protein [Bacteroidales bacterium]
MAFDLDKLTQMAKGRSEEATRRAQYRKENREWLRISQDIAIAIHSYMSKVGINQKELAERMQISPTYVGKLLKGQENLTLESICTIQRMIGETIIYVHRPYEHREVVEINHINTFVTTNRSEVYKSSPIIPTDYSPILGDVA